MKAAENIYLIGLMGAGKTTIGRYLAKSLSMPFYDSDKAIEELTGVDIPTIFAYEGEEGFRVREQNMIQELTRMRGIVLATGGGAIIREQNRQALKNTGFVVYLQCSIDKILQRTRRDTQRPLLNTDNPRKKLEQLLLDREAYYLSCADCTIETSSMQSKLVAQMITKKFNHLRECE
jgi:shikimate kinase